MPIDREEWFVGMQPEAQERARMLLEEFPGELYDVDEVVITVTPRGGYGLREMGPTVTMRQLIPVRAGVNGLRWKLERMLDELIEAKAKAYARREEAPNE